MSSNFRIFHNEPTDKEYFVWMELNGKGFVVNPRKNAKTKDFKYHHSRCMHIADPSPKFSFTTNGKTKICSNDLNEVLAELKKYKSYNGVFVPCATCNK